MTSSRARNPRTARSDTDFCEKTDPTAPLTADYPCGRYHAYQQTKPMKIPSTTAFAALAAFTAMPAAFAQDTAEPVLPEVSICDIFPCEEILIEEPVIIVCPGVDESLETFDPIVENEEPTGKEEEIANEEFTEEEFTGETEEEFVEDSTEEVTDGEVVEVVSEDGEGIVTIGGWPDGGVPIEWIKRGGGELDNPDVIFYSMAGGPVLQNVTGGASQEAGSSTDSAAARVLNQGETASDIENKVTSGAGVAKVAKKSTVAIVKEGRVFLR
jgi:hypothetical protein